MAIDVRGPQGPQKPQTQGPQGAMGKQTTGLSAAQATRNAEKAFDATFGSAATTTETAAATPQQLVLSQDALNVPEVKLQIQSMFQQLKAQFLALKPSGKTADAFLPPVQQAPVAPEQGAREALKLAQTPSSAVPKEAKAAFQKLNDLFWARQIEQQGALTNPGSPVALFVGSPDGQRMLQAAKPFLLQMLKELGAPPTKKDKGESAVGDKKGDKATTGSSGSGGAKETGANAKTETGANAAPSDVLSLSEQVKDGIVKALKPAVDKFGNMAIEELITMMFFAVAKDAEVDLRDQMKKMNHIIKMKDVLRAQKLDMDQSMKRMKGEAQREYDAAVARGDIDGTQISFDDYWSHCTIEYTPPSVNEETYDSTYVEPTLTFPNIKMDGEVVSSGGPAQPGGSSSSSHASFGIVGASASVGTIGASTSVQKMGGNADFSQIGAAGIGQMSASSPTIEVGANAGGFQMSKVGVDLSDLQASKADLSGLKVMLPQGPDIPPLNTLESVGKGISGEQMTLASEQLQGKLDSLSSQSEMEQIQMQIYMDRRKNAFDMLTNHEKKKAEFASQVSRAVGGG